MCIHLHLYNSWSLSVFEWVGGNPLSAAAAFSLVGSVYVHVLPPLHVKNVHVQSYSVYAGFCECDGCKCKRCMKHYFFLDVDSLCRYTHTHTTHTHTHTHTLTHKHTLHTLHTLLTQVLEGSIQMQDSDTMMKSFIDLADHCPKFLRSQIENIVELMLKVGEREER